MADNWDDENTYTDLPLNYEEMENEWADRYQEDGGQHWDVVAPVVTNNRTPFGSGYRLDSVIDAPKRIRQLYEMCQRDRWQVTRAKCFYQQALAMADYNDHCPEIANFFVFRPTYLDMSILQMRSYFTLRTQLRQGRYPEMSDSYLLVYIYETLMLIGVEKAQEALEILSDLRDHYGIRHQSVRTSLDLWTKDFVVYHDLQDKKERYFSMEVSTDKIALALANHEKLSDETFFALLEPMLKYKIKEAALYKKHPSDTSIVSGRTLKAAANILEERFHHPIDELFLGTRRKYYHSMFENAVFFQPNKEEDRVFEISPRRKYICKNGLWIVDTFIQNTNSMIRPLLSDVLHETDRQLRLAFGIKIKMKPRLQDERLRQAIELVVSDYLKEKTEALRPKIEVDFSKLDRIRKDAEVVKEALLTEEDTAADNDSNTVLIAADQEETAEFPSATATTAPPTAASSQTDAFFTSEEERFLQLLLEGDDWKAYLRSIHIPPGVMAENINDKMMDELGDIVLDDDGSGLTIIDDYLDDIKGKMTHPN